MDNPDQNEFWEDGVETPTRKRKRGAVTIKSILLFMAVVAASGVCIAQYARGIASGGQGTAVGQFAIINAMMPTVFLIGAFWFFRLFGRFLD